MFQHFVSIRRRRSLNDLDEDDRPVESISSADVGTVEFDREASETSKRACAQERNDEG